MQVSFVGAAGVLSRTQDQDRDAAGELHSETALPASLTRAQVHPEPGGDFAGIYQLDDATAQEVGEVLDALRTRLQANRLGPGEGRPYLIRTALVPLRPDDLTQQR